MNTLTGIAGLIMTWEHAIRLEGTLQRLCQTFRFPRGREGEFKWSPGRELWMRDHLVHEKRKEFFHRVVDACAEEEATVIAVVEDTKYAPATGVSDAENDVAVLFLERVENYAAAKNEHAIVITDRPPGDRRAEDDILTHMAEVLNSGTRFVRFRSLPFPVLSGRSDLMRTLQAADVIAGAVVAMVAGNKWAEDLFRDIVPLVRSEHGRRGGVGLKLHPDTKFVNLYYWLLGDSEYIKSNIVGRLPLKQFPYSASPYEV